MLNIYIRIGILAASLLYIPGAIEDFRDRYIWDYYLLAPYVVYAITFFAVSIMVFVKYALIAVGFFALLYFMHKYKPSWVGMGDVMGLPAMFAQAFDYRLFLVFFVAVTAIDVLRVYFKYGGVVLRAIPEGERVKWLPYDDGKFMYGVPMVGYAYLACFLASVAYVIISML